MLARSSLKSLFLATSAAFLLAACDQNDNLPPPPETEAVSSTETPAAEAQSQAEVEVSAEAVVKHYADLAHAVYGDALITARALDQATDELIANPTDANLEAARQAWVAARVPYQQSEVFRFGNAVVDDWEGQLNAWPLDEGLIDYVAADSYEHELGNDGATANIIGSREINVGGTALDVSNLTPQLLADLNEVGGSEANVATGYHAIEFLLWGQDLNGFEPGAGNRPATDYAQGEACTNGNCDRRAQYLDAATDLLVSDLEWMVAQWAPEQSGNYRAELTAADSQEVLQKMLFGMGSLSLGELAGERMKVAMEANSYEDEHDCFSDNTHNSHYYNAKGIQNIYLGSYERIDGSILSGESLSDLTRQHDAEQDQQLRTELEQTMQTLGKMKEVAERSENPMSFDMMIAPGNAEGAKLINTSIAALVQQTGSIERVATALGIAALGSDDAGHSF